MFKNSFGLTELQATLIKDQDGRTKIIFEQKPLIQTKIQEPSSDIENQVRLVEEEADAYEEMRRSTQRGKNHQSAPMSLSQKKQARLND